VKFCGEQLFQNWPTFPVLNKRTNPGWSFDSRNERVLSS
jgi:hypothetical protein